MNTKMFVVVGMIGFCSGAIATANAATTNLYAYSNPSGTCQLSIPTTDTQVRPKASGYRNEGAQNAFVVCGYSKDSIQDFQSIIIGVASMDGADHAVSCTAVTGLNGNTPLQYSTVTITAAADGLMGSKSWLPADFGSATTTIPGSFEPSVTCLLPAKVAIVYQAGKFAIDIGQ